jgi:hypothetical protein
MKVNIKPDVILNEKAIMQDIEKFARTCATTIVEEAAESIKKFAYEQMVGYYDEYDPRIYIRTDQMKNSSYKTFTTTTGNIYEGGVIINSENTNHERGTRFGGGEYTEEEIYDNVWIKGSHGYEIVGTKGTPYNGWNDTRHWREIQGLPDRINRIKRKAYSRDFKRELLSKGFEKAKAQSYSILKFS